MIENIIEKGVRVDEEEASIATSKMGDEIEGIPE